MAESLPSTAPLSSSEGLAAVLTQLLGAVGELKDQMGRQQEAQASVTHQLAVLQQASTLSSPAPPPGSLNPPGPAAPMDTLAGTHPGWCSH